MSYSSTGVGIEERGLPVENAMDCNCMMMVSLSFSIIFYHTNVCFAWARWYYTTFSYIRNFVDSFTNYYLTVKDKLTCLQFSLLATCFLLFGVSVMYLSFSTSFNISFSAPITECSFTANWLTFRALHWTWSAVQTCRLCSVLCVFHFFSCLSFSPLAFCLFVRETHQSS